MEEMKLAEMGMEMKRKRKRRRTTALVGVWTSAAGYLLAGLFFMAVVGLDFTAAARAQTAESFYAAVMSGLDRMDQGVFLILIAYGIYFFIQMRYKKGMEFLYSLPAGRKKLFSSGWLCGAGMLFLGYTGIFLFSALQLTGSLGQMTGLTVWSLAPACFGRFLCQLFLLSVCFFLNALFSGTAKASALFVLFAWGAGRFAEFFDRILYVYFGYRKQGIGCGIRDSLLVMKNLRGSFETAITRLEALGYEPYRAAATGYRWSWPVIAAAVFLLSLLLFLAGRKLSEKNDISARRRIFAEKIPGIAVLLMLLIPVSLAVMSYDINKNIEPEIRTYQKSVQWSEEDYVIRFQKKYGQLAAEDPNFFESYLESVRDPMWDFAYVDSVAADMKSTTAATYYVTYSTMGGMPAYSGRFILIFGITTGIGILVGLLCGWLRKEET